MTPSRVSLKLKQARRAGTIPAGGASRRYRPNLVFQARRADTIEPPSVLMGAGLIKGQTFLHFPHQVESAGYRSMPLACPGDCCASGYKCGLAHSPRGKCPRLARGMVAIAATTPTDKMGHSTSPKPRIYSLDPHIIPPIPHAIMKCCVPGWLPEVGARNGGGWLLHFAAGNSGKGRGNTIGYPARGGRCSVNGSYEVANRWVAPFCVFR